MANPSNTQVTVDGASLNAFSTQAGISSAMDANGMPMMGSMTCALEFSADIHDTKNVSFETLKKFFELCHLPTRDKIKDIKIEFWTDDSRKDVLFTLSFRGWISSWTVSSGGGSNHILSLSLQPTLDKNNYSDLKIGN